MLGKNKGERNGAAKLTEAQVLDIRRRRQEGESRKSVATRYGVNEHTVKSVTTYLTWGWLDEKEAVN